MNYNDINEKIKQITIEDYIWIIYIGIIVTSWYANKYESDYFNYNDMISKEKYRRMMIRIFTILVIIYFYFFKGSWNDLMSISCSDSCKKKELTYLSYVGSLFILFSGLIFLYIAYKDEQIDVEIAFN